MSRKERKSYRALFRLWVCLALLGAAFIAIISYDELVLKPKIASERAEMSVEERLGVGEICLGGVAYWHADRDREALLAPKFSPGNAAPDTCE